MSDVETKGWKHLARKPCSSYQQLFVKDTRIAARLLYGMHVNTEEPMSVDEIAEAYGLPSEAVREAIAYCQANPAELEADWRREEAHALSSM